MEVLCFGDSNTYGLGGFSLRESYPREETWPWILSEKWGVAVKNRGENGRRIPFSEKELFEVKRLLASHPKTALLIVMLGTNDALAGCSAEEIEKRMDCFLSFLSPFAPKLLLIVPPDGASYAEYFEKLSRKYGSFFADSSVWQLPLQPDGIHLTREGHRLFVENIFSFEKKISRK